MDLLRYPLVYILHCFDNMNKTLKILLLSKIWKITDNILLYLNQAMQLYKVYFIVSLLIRFFECFEIAQETAGDEKSLIEIRIQLKNALM